MDDRRPNTELRSPQQIERDSQRQKSFEARRAASHPHLSYEDEIKKDLLDGRPQPQAALNHVRRGSLGNIMENVTVETNHTNGKENGNLLRENIGRDNGERENIVRENIVRENGIGSKETSNGIKENDEMFLKRNGSRDNKLANRTQDSITNGVDNKLESQQINESSKDDTKMNSVLSGTPRKRLEGEIGKIEGVYNVGQRSKIQDELRSLRKQQAESGASSDYDKPGQSSSNADSGRGSAAYSSGRRPGTVDTSNESSDPHPSCGRSYRDQEGRDSEWIDIAETELRHILEPKLHELSLHGNNVGIANSTMSESISSMTPPLPPLSPGEQSSPNETPRNFRYKNSSLPYGSKPEYDGYGKSKTLSHSSSRWHGSSGQKHRSGKKVDHGALLRSKQGIFCKHCFF